MLGGGVLADIKQKVCPNIYLDLVEGSPRSKLDKGSTTLSQRESGEKAKEVEKVAFLTLLYFST